MRYTIVLTLIFSFPILVSANKNQGFLLKGRVVGGNPGQDSLTISFYNDAQLLYNVGGWANTIQSINIPTNKNGEFIYTIREIESIAKVNVVFLGKKFRANVFSPIYPFIPVKSGDSLFIEITVEKRRVQCNYSGLSAPQFELAEELIKSLGTQSFPGTGHEMFKDAENVESNLNQIISKTETVKDSIAARLNTYNHHIEADILQLYKTEFYGRLNRKIIVYINRFFRNSEISSDILKLILSTYHNNLEPIDEKFQALSIYYCYFLIEKTILEANLNEASQNYGNIDILNALKEDYNGVLLDKLLLAYCMDPGLRVHSSDLRSISYEELLNSAYDLMEVPKLQLIIGRKIKRYAKGTLAYDFTLPDANDNLVTLSDYSGKVVLLEIYATICTGCRHFAKTLKQSVFPAYQNNEGVVFIAISVEKDNARWLQDIKEGHNVSVEYQKILYTEGMGLDHPVVKYYGIEAVPTIFLIDKDGKITNSSSDTLSPTITGERLIEMINDALRSS